MPALLEAREVRAAYGGLTALRDVSLGVPPGALVTLIGRNGAGKSTLLHVLAGLVPAAHGRVLFEGVDVTSLPPHRRRRLGILLVPEGRGIFPGLSVDENLRASGVGGATREEILGRYPVLADRAGQAAGTLSGGEQQMLALAPAWDPQARVVMLDEPSLALAPRLVDEVFDQVEALRAAGRTVMLVEQYATRAIELADLVYVMHKGTVAFAGEPGELAHASLEGAYLGRSMR